MSKKVNVTKDELFDLYINQGLSTRDIATKFNIGQTTVRRYLVKYEIPTRTSMEGKATSAYQQKLTKIKSQISETLHKHNENTGHILTKTCIICGTEFQTIASKEKITCSKECLKKHLSIINTKNSRICQICGVEIKRGQKYCPECSKIKRKELSENQKKRITVQCSYCGKNIERTPSTLHNLNYCSVECMSKHYSESEMFTGENNVRWTGGKRHYTGNWLKCRNLARKRDNYTCQICGVTEMDWHKQMDVHHIINYNLFEDKTEANKLDNLVCLCNLCHSYVHSNTNKNKLFIKDKI